MPEYNFQNIKSKKIKVLTMTMAEREQYILDHPNEIQVFTKPLNYVDAMRIGVYNQKAKDFNKQIVSRMKASIPQNRLDRTRFPQNIGEI